MRGETQHEFLAMASAWQREPNLSFPRKGAQPEKNQLLEEDIGRGAAGS